MEKEEETGGVRTLWVPAPNEGHLGEDSGIPQDEVPPSRLQIPNASGRLSR